MTWQGPQPLHNPLGVARLGQIYSRTSAFYDSLVAEKQAAAKLVAIEALARQLGERFLEIGVGTGWAFGRIIASTNAENAYALDVAEGMLQVARDALMGEHGVVASLLLGDARALPFPKASFDCILSSYTFDVLPEPDIAPAIAEMKRVLRPGGRAIIVNLTDATDGSGDGEAMIEDWKRRYVIDPEYFGGARPLQLSEMLQAGGFDRLSRRYVGPDWPSEVLLSFRPR
jgi:ubiquinone/menaquinone biosynthesis C-methylase UbiE